MSVIHCQFAWLVYSLENTKISSNRGVNGIDGQLATAIGRNWGRRDSKHQSGESAALGRVWLGDGTLLHDASSLYLETGAPPIELCCIANDGGRIFDLLPAAQATDPQLTRASNPRFDPLAACTAAGWDASLVTDSTSLAGWLSHQHSQRRALIIDTGARQSPMTWPA